MGKFCKEDLINLPKTQDTLVGIDSDGCVFDSMVTKQCHFFHPHIIRLWNLEKIEKQVREAAEFFNLYSKWRGQNRFIDLLHTFDALPDMPGVKEADIVLPPTESLRAYVESGLALGNPSLEKEVERTNDPELARILDWSHSLNKDITANMTPIPPFKYVMEALGKVTANSDLIVVSQTPEVALVHEWDLHKMDHFVPVIAGQELGTKKEHLEMARGDRYPENRVLMIGDAPGDKKAAEGVNACFYPINPGHEEASWKRFIEEAYDKFLDGSFEGEYQQMLIDEFDALLPEKFPWLS